jgi:multidrug resistance efflux pump
LRATQARLSALQEGPRAESVTQAQANLASAQAALALLQSSPTPLEIEAARLAVESARNALYGAQSSRDALCGNPNLADAQCDNAEAQVLVAETAVKQTENQLAQVQQGPDPQQIAQAQQAVRAAEAQLALAREPVTAQEIAQVQAEVDAAQAALDALNAGARAQERAAAQAQVARARAGVDAAQAAMEPLTLTAPIGGTVVDLSARPGQWVVPGQQVAALADLDTLVVETTDLSELDVPRLSVGAPAEVLIEALAEAVPGRVSEIAPLAETLGGDVVYRVTVTLDERPEGLRAGMSAEIEF